MTWRCRSTVSLNYACVLSRTRLWTRRLQWSMPSFSNHMRRRAERAGSVDPGLRGRFPLVVTVCPHPGFALRPRYPCFSLGFAVEIAGVLEGRAGDVNEQPPFLAICRRNGIESHLGRFGTKSGHVDSAQPSVSYAPVESVTLRFGLQGYRCKKSAQPVISLISVNRRRAEILNFRSPLITALLHRKRTKHNSFYGLGLMTAAAARRFTPIRNQGRGRACSGSSHPGRAILQVSPARTSSV